MPKTCWETVFFSRWFKADHFWECAPKGTATICLELTHVAVVEAGDFVSSEVSKWHQGHSVLSLWRFFGCLCGRWVGRWWSLKRRLTPPSGSLRSSWKDGILLMMNSPGKWARWIWLLGARNCLRTIRDLMERQKSSCNDYIYSICFDFVLVVMGWHRYVVTFVAFEDTCWEWHFRWCCGACAVQHQSHRVQLQRNRWLWGWRFASGQHSRDRGYSFTSLPRLHFFGKRLHS